jgi:glycosyltransferase involved in cell wall biosynthesis
MNLVFISSGHYPNGGASTNRHLAYGKGLAEAGHKVIFILLSKQENELQENGINFISVLDFKKLNIKIILGKQYFHIKSIIKAKKILNNFQSQENIDAIILLDTQVWILLPFILFAQRNHIKVFHERTEYPFVVNGKGLLNHVNLILYSSFILKRFDGLFVINKALKQYFSILLNNRIPIEIINMIVDPSRFDNLTTDSNYGQYIAYCGTLQGDKDGIDILIKAFADSLKTGKILKEMKLLIIGDTSNKKSYNKLQQLCYDSQCENNVFFTGKIDRYKMPVYLKNASALALARPNNKQAEGGFPTKLGEYLATGNPVIITNVGEIGEYLVDGDNAFIAIPGSVDSFSLKIQEVFSDYNTASEVGTRGKELVYKEFNYFYESIKLANFIKSV